MIDFAAARRMMVDGQVRTSDVNDLRIIAAMLEPLHACNLTCTSAQLVCKQRC